MTARDWADLDLQRPRVASRGRVPTYSPPPPTAPPPIGWRLERIVDPVPPRVLPVQDHEALDADELRASRVTIVIGASAAAVLAIMLAVLCGQLLR